LLAPVFRADFLEAFFFAVLALVFGPLRGALVARFFRALLRNVEAFAVFEVMRSDSESWPAHFVSSDHRPSVPTTSAQLLCIEQCSTIVLTPQKNARLRPFWWLHGGYLIWTPRRQDDASAMNI
jgi:hypothetical protein